ncbi:uncharacterized protein [Nicotiana tomentosiformis]|uniref:uncharacterized protein n=1 Tax=Nicotiana tomentosiformis TaxID=4098 RepID=UPI00388C8F10
MGIEVNPVHIKAIEEIPDILTSKKRCRVLKKQNQFEWTDECQQALKNLKSYLSNPPLLAKPKDGERLLIYLAVSETAVNAVLVREDRALIPVDIGEPSTMYTQATEESNEEEMRMNLDLLEERREATLIRMAAQKQMIERYYNRKANLQYFKIEDFVLKNVFQSTKSANVGKLIPNWEGPYRIRGIAGKGAYELETMDGKILPSNWNDVLLKKYYF